MARPSLAALSASRAPLPPLRTFSWEATSLPSGVTFARTGTVLVIDNAGQSHLTSYGANAWSPEHDTGSSYYQYNLPGYTNTLTAPRQWANGAGNWAAGHVSGTSTAAGPDGNAGSGYRVTLTGAQYGPYRDHGADAVLAYSGWFRANSGTTISDSYISNAAGTTIVRSDLAALTTTWTRKTILHSAGRYLAPADGTLPSAHSEDVLADCQQLVVGTTYCPPYTDGTVGATSYSVAGSDFVAGSGRFDVDLGTLTALEAATTPAADQYLFYWDANNHLKLRQSDRKFVLTLGGSVAAASAAQSYGAGTSLGACRVWSLGTGCGFTINGTTTSAAAVAASSVPTTAYLGSNNGSNAFPSKLAGTFTARNV